MTPEERELRRALEARSGEPSPQFHARLSAAVDAGRPSSGLIQATAIVAVIAITLGTVGALVLSRNARNIALREGPVSGTRLSSPAPSPTMVPQEPVLLPSGAQLMAPSTNVVWVLVENRLLFRSSDKGKTWEKRYSPVQQAAYSPVITFIDDHEGWVLAGLSETGCNGAGAEVFHTTDGAATWHSIALVSSRPLHTESGIAYTQCKDRIYFVDSTHGFLTAWDDNDHPTIYRTVDGGKSWSGSTLPDPPDFKTSPGGFTLRAGWVKRFGNTIYVQAWGKQAGDIPDRQYMFRSTDGGATWSWMTKVPPRSIVMVTESRWLQLLIPGQSSESINGGQQWHPYESDFSTDTPVGRPQIVFADSQVGYAEGRGALQLTVDGGLHWERIATPGTGSPPDPTRLTSQKCSGAPATTLARDVMGRYTIRMPSGWADTGDYVRTESLMLELTAPASYGNSPTRIQFRSLPYDVPADFGKEASAHSIAVEESTKHNRFTSPNTAVTSVSDCTVAAEPAAVFGYAEGNDRGYWLLIVHHERLLGVQLFGSEGIGDKALQEGLGMIGSIVWTS
jgi:photosystem II stability/assembly factor-like uncharacterized protein